MPVPEKLIPVIEDALGIKLFGHQKEYLAHGTPFPPICPCVLWGFTEENSRRCKDTYDGTRCRLWNRATGKTLAESIDLAMSEGEPIDFVKLKRIDPAFADAFADVWIKLYMHGLPVRKVIGYDFA